ncbi:restriction endonuclease subunit S [Wenzhouxiangella sp. AB-CW3]|uniref:restriction endonuclease subunit S n=1 Tax=Wenzhouxiangella sp. AB-CW3 TaxID=2771012 RepID=UPI00168BBBA6|nr:restriction endonuclease subunit S [Wenzhouxiangella sp. AB-CW3]QOC24085.1 restriction endonuclease subunit S [Wenzhouxiangella sp. AB-CW3]
MNVTSSSIRLGAMDLYHPLPCPDGWTTRRLRFVTRINKAQPIALAPADEASFVPMAAIGEHGGIQLEQVKALDEIGDGYTYFADGDVVVAKITPCFENGKGAFVEGLKNGIAFGTTELHVVRPAQDIDGRFLFYLSISELFRKLGEGAMYGAGGQKRVPELFIKDFQALLPPLHQQQKIAAFLDRKTAEIDTLIGKKRRLLDRLAEKRTALITRAVTKGLNPDAPMKDSGIEWLGEIPAHWEIASISWLSRVFNGATPSRSRNDYWDGSCPWLSSGKVNDWKITAPSAFISQQAVAETGLVLAPSGSVVIGMVGQGRTRGLAARLEIDAYINQNMAAIVAASPLNTAYLHYALVQSYQPIREHGRGGQRDALNCEIVGSIRIPLPPLPEQQKIAAQLDQQAELERSQRRLVSEQIDYLEEYRSALITNAVTGQIKVA